MSTHRHKPASRTRSSAPVLAVELAIRQPTNRSAETRRATLAGGRQPPINPRKSEPLSTQAKENAARQIARGARPADIAGLLTAMAHSQRVQILLRLLGGEATHRALAKTTGLKAGPLYHHLRELRLAGLIGPKVRDLYVLTSKGGRAILAAMAMERLCR